MKTRILAGTFAFLSAMSSLIAGPRDEQWQQVNQAADQGLPKTAIERLDPIITGALADKAYAEAVRAIGRRIALEGMIEGNKPEEKIIRLESELVKAPQEMKPVMEGLLAHWYWQYFQHNRWRFQQRTSTAASPGADLQTWDLSRILAEIAKHFDAALADDAALKSTPIQAFDALIDKGTAPDVYRPTLFDFLSYQALSFYQIGEMGAIASEDAFEIDAASPIFDESDAFLKWKPDTTDTSSAKLRAIRIYQELLRFHAKDADRSAYLDADLARFDYGFNVAVGEGKNERYETALNAFCAANAKHEITTRAIHQLAMRKYQAGLPDEARTLALRGLAAHPKSHGADLCFNLISSIETPSISLATEAVWGAPLPPLEVSYKNITKLYFRVYEVDFAEELSRSRWNVGGYDRERLGKMLLTKPVREWSVDLPATKDYQVRVENVPAPVDLKPGFYVIFGSCDAQFGGTNNQVAVANFCVSNLSLVLGTRYAYDKQIGFVLRSETGDPVSGANIRVWRRNREGWFKPSESLTADENGRFEVMAKNGAAVLLAESEGQAVSSLQPISTSDPNPMEFAGQSTFLFTDRAIYRPGQTIQYKGIVIGYDKDAGKYEARAGRKIVVIFNDANGQEISKVTHTTNDYGSFDGVFTAPRDRLMGAMSIRTDDGTGNAGFSVEEYKRPKFQVSLQPPREAVKLESRVEVTGHATAYTGAAIGGAKVQWRVERGAQAPRWCWWWTPPPSRAIAHGTLVTKADGSFSVEFNALPDRSVPEKNEPVFTYTVVVDVTDVSGETRSQVTSVRVGYTALEAVAYLADWQEAEKPVEVHLSTRTLDGQPQAASGVLKVHVVEQPEAVVRPTLLARRRSGPIQKADDPANPESWVSGQEVMRRDFTTDATGSCTERFDLGPGLYRLVVEAKDKHGKPITDQVNFEVLDTRAARYVVKKPDFFGAPVWFCEPGGDFKAYWGTGYARGRAFVEVECNGRLLQRYWTNGEKTQEAIVQAVSEEMRGGFTVRVMHVQEGRAYFNSRVVNVPWSNKRLSVAWETFRSKLLPGQKESWTAVIKGPDAERAAAEMVATMYDASLDQFRGHGWISEFGVFRYEWSRDSYQLQNLRHDFMYVRGGWQSEHRNSRWSYRAFPSEILSDAWGWQYERRMKMMAMPSAPGSMDSPMAAAEGMSAPPSPSAASMGDDAYKAFNEEKASGAPAPSPSPDMSKVSARKNLNETAFFFPHLLAGNDGSVRIDFTMPEALTEWRFMGFAHDKGARAGYLSAVAVTAKELMVEPNPPRFLREGDTIEFSVKVSNQSDTLQRGTVKLTFADAATLESADAALGNKVTEQPFDIPAKQSRNFSWSITVPDGLGYLTYKAVAATAGASDGEEAFVPVLSRRILVTESLPLPIRGKQTKSFALQKLIDSGKSDTLRSQSFTVQMTSQPAWYAVMALPYLMEYPYECSEQVFNRLYANALARYIANSDPKIRRVFELWKNTPALESPLTKNQDLKSVMLEETPWVREAKSETEARRNVGLLFDQNRLDSEIARALQTLSDRQLGEGLWSWFPGGQPSEYISLYIMTGFGRLRHLGVDVDVVPALKAVQALDIWMEGRYQSLLKEGGAYSLSYTDALYLYGRSFFLEDVPVAEEHKAAIAFYVDHARRDWLSVDSRQSQAHLALALMRFGDVKTARAITRSLKERSVGSEELGMFWRETELSWWWYRAPIETQALMIEAFAEVDNDAQTVEDCKVWLLKQKQTQNWGTTKATADAVYGLLIRGKKLLASDALVEVTLGGETIRPKNVEAGTGFYEEKFNSSVIRPEMGRITVKKVDDGVSWGSVHWQYLEDMAKVTPHEGTPLKLKKALYVKRTTKKGQELVPVTGPVSVGDELVVRIELRTDRDMEFVHLKDQRGSGAEPVNVISQYKFQDGLAYYESTRDTASHFFIDYLPKGTYVFEYSTRVQLKGAYQTGIAEIQCMYAPEFNSHSESIPLEVK